MNTLNILLNVIKSKRFLVLVSVILSVVIVVIIVQNSYGFRMSPEICDLIFAQMEAFFIQDGG